jgi:hypothetical protein
MKRRDFRRWLAIGLRMVADWIENPPRYIITPPNCSPEELAALRRSLERQDWGASRPCRPPPPPQMTRRRWLWLRQQLRIGAFGR